VQRADPLQLRTKRRTDRRRQRLSRPRKPRQDSGDLGLGQHDRQTPRTMSADERLAPARVPAQDGSVQEQKSRKRLIVRGGADLPFG
jgi:hypothetical protein